MLKSMLTSTHDFPQHKRVCSSVSESSGEDPNLVIDNVISQRKNSAVVVELAK